MTFAALGDSAVVVTLGGGESEAVLARVRALAQALEEAKLPGVVDIVPAYASIAVFRREPSAGHPSFDELRQAIEAVAKAATGKVRRLRRRLRARKAAAPLVEIPVCYGGEFGPDLPEVAEHASVDPVRAISLHQGGDYRVQAIGFAPGFPYLSGLPPALHTPRKATPRTAVPAGSVGIGGGQTGVYPLETPGGWQLIGRTPLALFDPAEKPPARLRVGDRVKFRAIQEAEFQRLQFEHRPRREKPARAEPPPEGRALRVIRPGLLTTVQDLGRPGFRAAGVPAGGAMDSFALRVANLLVGNPENAAGLEITLAGPELEFPAETLVAVAGAEFDGVPSWRPRLVGAGERLSFGGCRRGCRAYLAVAGGLDAPAVLGGRGAFLRGEFGGFEGRPLQEGDWLPLGRAGRAPAVPPSASWRVSRSILPAYSSEARLRVIRGAQAAEFGAELWSAEFVLTTQADRMGLRLAGPALERRRGAELLSTAVAPGTVQVPPDGQPILLMADAQTIGGYPQAAHIAGCDLPVAAQLRPGDRVSFQEISLEEAQALARTRERDLGILRAGLGCP
ncbi:MAG TPA: 5-oxoprolinase subunit PxpB [Opitutaceae bacterium]|jgi:KipI family sensor histidine kinase inhibitor|nr:5-oxoprolinase subunit PxpB [Opitutaceae bacterium]